MIDAHFHVWRLARADYGWLTPALGAIHRDVEVAHWRALAAPLGIRGGVLVQLQPALTPALEAMTEHGLVFDALVRALHLPRVRELARRHPALRIVVDYGAKPAIAQAEWQLWADELRRLADETGATCTGRSLRRLAAAVPATRRFAGRHRAASSFRRQCPPRLPTQA